MQLEADQIEKEVIDISYNMNGALPWMDAWETTNENRKKILKYVKELMAERARQQAKH